MARRPSVFDRALPKNRGEQPDAPEPPAPASGAEEANTASSGKVGIASLMSAAPGTASADRGVPPTPAVMAMKRSLKDLSEASIQSIPLDQIGDSIIHDRIDLTEDLEPLMKSLEENGQETAVKVRYAAPGADRPVYEIIVGRRRVAAARALGWDSIKGLILKVSDEDLLRSLVSENSARKETTFIGRAQLAYLASKAGHSDDEIATIYSSDRTLINRMIRIYEVIGPAVISRIGDAPDVGRRRWQDLRSRLEASPRSPDEISALIAEGIERYSDEIVAIWTKRVSSSSTGNETIPQSTLRFYALEKMLSASLPDKAPARRARADRRPLPGFGSMQRKPKELVLKIDRGLDPELLRRLEEALPELVQKVISEAQKDKTPHS